MKKRYKFIILYLVAILSLFGLYYPIDIFNKKEIELQKQILLKQAQTHFNDQVNTRRWNASFGGVYVKQTNDLKPNPYLKNNILKVDENLTLIKINPAWMTRQLSEISDIKNFHFKITSLNPLNPNNTTTEFEKKALNYFEKTSSKEYYEFGDDNHFNYMGALITTKACLSCHEQQGYKLGDIRGGISVVLDSSTYHEVTASIHNNTIIVKIFILLFLSTLTYLIHRELKHTESLQGEVKKRIKEIQSTKQLLQKILDSELSFLLVSDGTKVIYANQTLLNFFGFESLEGFKKRYHHISDTFEKTDDEGFLQQNINGEHWITYLIREQNTKDLKVLIKKDEKKRYFKPHAKEIEVKNEKLYLIIFDEITYELKKMKKLEDEASRDTLTKLFNRNKFNDVLPQEINLCCSTQASLSLIFLDIDHFKRVNDTLGHDVGDEVLIEIANILTSSIRASDFVARWGGEEFIITLQSTNKFQAIILAEKLRQNVEKYKFKQAGNITISLGVTEYIENEDIQTVTKRLDEALYEAKKSGRNKVIVK